MHAYSNAFPSELRLLYVNIILEDIYKINEKLPEVSFQPIVGEYLADGVNVLIISPEHVVHV